MNEAVIRLGSFLFMLLVVGVWESLFPKRALIANRSKRWVGNIGIAALGAVLIRVLFPTAAAVGVAVFSEANGWGVLNSAEIPAWMAIALSVIALDLTVYLQHVVFHAIPVLWRIHSVHHHDRDFDMTTGIRFHPVEIVLSLAIKSFAVIAIGAPVIAVLVFELILNGAAMFNHANGRIPLWLDHLLRLVIVTPDMHRVHHSVEHKETNSNFGFNLSWWDRLAGTYIAQPRLGHLDMAIGLKRCRRCPENQLARMLAWPFIQPSAKTD